MKTGKNVGGLFYLVTILAIAGVALISLSMPVHAQDISISQSFEIAGNVPDGSIITAHDGKYALSAEPYDKNIIGIATANPAIELRNSDEVIPGTYPVVSQGIVTVRVSGENGAVHAGDAITTSSKPGVGMKATKSGFIVGISQAGLEEGSGEESIPVTLAIKFSFAQDAPTSQKIGSQLADVLKLSSSSILQDPVTTLRYVLAVAVVVVAFVVTFLTVGKVARGGVEAIGRNPLASKTITAAIILNVILSIGIMGIGVVAAYAITVL